MISYTLLHKTHQYHYHDWQETCGPKVVCKCGVLEILWNHYYYAFLTAWPGIQFVVHKGERQHCNIVQIWRISGIQQADLRFYPLRWVWTCSEISFQELSFSGDPEMDQQFWGCKYYASFASVQKVFCTGVCRCLFPYSQWWVAIVSWHTKFFVSHSTILRDVCVNCWSFLDT